MNTSTPSSSHFAQNGVKFRVREILAGDAAGDRDAAEAEVFDGVLDLLGGQVGVLQRGRREGDKAVGVAGAEFDELLVLHRISSAAASRSAVPVRVDAQRLDIDAGAVHLRQPVPTSDQRRPGASSG